MTVNERMNGWARPAIWATVLAAIPWGAILFNKADWVQTKQLLVVFVIIWLLVYWILTLLKRGQWAIGQMQSLFASVVPNTPYVARGKNMTPQVRTMAEKVASFLAYTLFIIMLDIYLVLGMIVGYEAVSGPVPFATIWESAFSSGENTMVALFIFLLIGVYFAGRYTYALVSQDPALKAGKPWTVKYVFDRIMIMWLTFGDGEDVRLPVGQKPRFIHDSGFRLGIAVAIGIGMYWYSGGVFSLLICVFYALSYYTFLRLYRIDPSRVAQRPHPKTEL